MRALLSHLAWQKMRNFVDLCPTEISGLGKVEVRDGDFLVTDIAIFEQEVSGTHSDIEAKALAKFQVEMMKKGENMKDWWCWWHSHANMKAFFSGRDTATMDESTEFKMLLSIVTNHAHEFEARIDLHYPIRMNQKLEVDILEEENPKILALCKAEIAKKVKKPVYKRYGSEYHTAWPKGGHMDAKNQTGFKTGGQDFQDYRVWDEEAQAFITKAESERKKEKQGKELTWFQKLPFQKTILVGEPENEEKEEDYDKLCEQYYDMKLELVDQVREAKLTRHKQQIAIAIKELEKHVAKGKQYGFEPRKRK